MRCWVATSQTMTPSSVVTASMRSSGLNTTLGLDPPWPTRARRRGRRRSDIDDEDPAVAEAHGHELAVRAEVQAEDRSLSFGQGRRAAVGGVLQHHPSVATAAHQQRPSGLSATTTALFDDVELRRGVGSTSGDVDERDGSSGVTDGQEATVATHDRGRSPDGDAECGAGNGSGSSHRQSDDRVPAAAKPCPLGR